MAFPVTPVSNGFPVTFVGPGAELIGSGSFGSANTQVFTATDISDRFSYLMLRWSALSCDTTTRQPYFQVSTDGTNYDTTAGNYFGQTITGTTVAALNVASLGMSATATNAQAFAGSLCIRGYQGGMYPRYDGWIQSNTTNYNVFGNYIGSTSAIKRLRMIWNSTGSSDAGTYALYGIK